MKEYRVAYRFHDDSSDRIWHHGTATYTDRDAAEVRARDLRAASSNGYVGPRDVWVEEHNGAAWRRLDEKKEG